MDAVQRYDPDLGMFVEQPCKANVSQLCFQRWLVDNARGEHEAASSPAGDFAIAIHVLRTDRESL